MKREFDFERTGKKIPYSVPDRFFEDITKLTLEKARQRERKIKTRKLLVLYSSAASVLILVTIGFLMLTINHDHHEMTIVQTVTEEEVLQDIQPEELFIPDTSETKTRLELENDPPAQVQENSIDILIAEMSDEELQQLETVVNGELFLDEIINN